MIPVMRYSEKNDLTPKRKIYLCIFHTTLYTKWKRQSWSVFECERYGSRRTGTEFIVKTIIFEVVQNKAKYLIIISFDEEFWISGERNVGYVLRDKSCLMQNELKKALALKF